MAAFSGVSSSSSHQNVCISSTNSASIQSSTAFYSKTPSCNTVFSIDGLRWHIFAFLPFGAAVNTCHLNRTWKSLENDGNIWRVKFSQDVQDVFAPLVRQGLVIWKHVPLYSLFSPFIASMIAQRHSKNDFIEFKNPTLQALYPDEYLSYIMPGPFVQYGNYRFAICNRTEIEVFREEDQKSFFLKDEEGIMFTHLAVEGPFVFVLRADGVIGYWNYIEKRKIGEIQTAESEALKQEESPHKSSFCGRFDIKNGIIIIRYNADCVNVQGPFEIIPYEDPKKRQFIESLPLDSILLPCIAVIRDNQIIMVAKDSTNLENDPTNPCSIWKKKFSNHQVNRLSTHSLSWTALSQRTLEGITIRNSVRGFEIGNQKFILMKECIVIQNLVFSFFSGVFSMDFESPEALNTINVNVIRIDGETARCVDSFQEWLPLHSATPQWRTDLLKRLLLIAQRELGWPIPVLAAPPVVAATHRPKPRIRPKCCVIA